METTKKKTIVSFRYGDSENRQIWNKEFDNLESLRNYLRVKTIQRLSIRTFVEGLGKLMTIKSYITPNELTQENFIWFQDSNSPEEKFIVVNCKRS
jgi:hypothetical protein